MCVVCVLLCVCAVCLVFSVHWFSFLSFVGDVWWSSVCACVFRRVGSSGGSSSATVLVRSLVRAFACAFVRLVCVKKIKSLVSSVVVELPKLFKRLRLCWLVFVTLFHLHECLGGCQIAPRLCTGVISSSPHSLALGTTTAPLLTPLSPCPWGRPPIPPFPFFYSLICPHRSIHLPPLAPLSGRFLFCFFRSWWRSCGVHAAPLPGTCPAPPPASTTSTPPLSFASLVHFSLCFFFVFVCFFVVGSRYVIIHLLCVAGAKQQLPVASLSFLPNHLISPVLPSSPFSASLS